MKEPWMPHQIVYQIFPDRFAIGGPETSASKLAQPAYHRPGYVRRRWEERPERVPRGHDFFGGDLQGIVDHLDHIERLGATTVYLTPIFASPSNHKYDTTDYDSIDPQFGDEASLRRLVEALHARHMRLILDISINHVSQQHPWFVRAVAGEEPYRNWFTLREDGGYLRWRDHGHMPELNLGNALLQDALFRKTDSVLQRYLAMGVDGWRLDVAPDLGVAMMNKVRQVLSEAYPDTVLIGEVMGFAADWVADDDCYHGVMNYFFRDGILGWLAGHVSGLQVAEALRESYRGAGHDGSVSSWNMLSSHDVARLRTAVPDAALRWLALVAQFTLPGVPMIYYGEEAGLEGGTDPDCRGPMPWDESRWDREAWDRYRALIRLRQSRRELQVGEMVMLSHTLNTDALVFLRHTDVPHEVSLVAINPGRERLHKLVLLPYSHLYHALPMRNLFLGSHLQMEAGSVWVDVPPRSAAVWVPDESRYQHYSFFKRYE